jgi:hypothetical protein
LPAVRAGFSAVGLALRETQTDTLITELLSSDLDAVMVGLPVQDAFLRAVPAEGPLASARPGPSCWSARISCCWKMAIARATQALKVRANVDPRRLRSYDATTLATIVQPVAIGQG